MTRPTRTYAIVLTTCDVYFTIHSLYENAFDNFASVGVAVAVGVLVRVSNEVGMGKAMRSNVCASNYSISQNYICFIFPSFMQ